MKIREKSAVSNTYQYFFFIRKGQKFKIFIKILENWVIGSNAISLYRKLKFQSIL